MKNCTALVARISLSLTLLALGAAIAVAQRPNDPGQVKFRGAAFPVEEEAGVVTVVVKRQRGATGEVTVDWETTDGTALAGEDYEAAAGTLVWPDGDRADRSFEITILDDDLNEGQEVFGVSLLNPTGGLQLSPPSTAVVRIKPSDRDGEDDDGDDDEGDDEDEMGTIRLVSVVTPAFESSNLATVEVERFGGSDGPASVDFLTIDGSAVGGTDYVPVNGTLEWADGEDGGRSFDITLFDDTEAEPLETITVVLTGAMGAQLGSVDVGSVVIIDDDGGAGACVPDEETLCLRDGRFQVTGTWTDFEGNVGSIQWVPSSDESGLGWFFEASNIELLLKILQGCPLNDHFWVFYAATTNVGYEIEITDLQTDAVQTYVNELGEVALATTDVFAFSCE